MNIRRELIRLVSFASIAFVSVAQADGYLGPTTDFGFTAPPAFDYFYLEDFEDGLLNTPGVSASGGIVLGGGFADSVEVGGRSFYPGTRSVSFQFDAGTLGRLPTHVGWIWTDVGNVLAGGTAGFGQVQFEAFGPAGNSLGLYGPFGVGDGLFNGQVAEDRFLGIVSLTGISSITITMPDSDDWEMDRLQYGAAAVPIPAGIWLMASGLASLVIRRRRTFA